MTAGGEPRSSPPGRAPAATVRVVCGVIGRGDCFLAARRGAGQSNAGLWEFPGGKVRESETPETALLRELDEELGIVAALLRPLTPRVHAYPWTTIELIPFVCAITQGEPVPREHEALRWVDAAQARSLRWAEADIPVVEEYCGGERAGPVGAATSFDEKFF